MNELDGTITNAAGQPLAYTHVLITPLPALLPNEFGTVSTTIIDALTDPNGFFSMTLKSGYYQIDVIANNIQSFNIFMPTGDSVVNLPDAIVTIPTLSPAPTTGVGSPEGVYIATIGTYYWDSLNKIQYVKDTSSTAYGWVAITEAGTPQP